MTDSKRKKQGESIKLPQELQEELRREIAPYLARGEKGPSRGALLLAAWRAYKGLLTSTISVPAGVEESTAKVVEFSNALGNPADQAATDKLRAVAQLHQTKKALDRDSGELGRRGKGLGRRPRHDSGGTGTRG